MASLRGITIKRNDRAIFLGATGSGKTTLAKALMYGLKNVAIIDPKRTFRLPESWSPTTTDDREIVETWDKSTPLIYRPDAESLRRPDASDWFFEWAFNRGNTLVYVDEAMLVTNGTNPPIFYAACIQQGRERGVGVWHATQRPSRVPIVLLSESEHVFAFRLRNPDDRKRVADYTDFKILQKEAIGHGFWYYEDKSQTLRYFKSANVGELAK